MEIIYITLELPESSDSKSESKEQNAKFDESGESDEDQLICAFFFQDTNITVEIMFLANEVSYKSICDS